MDLKILERLSSDPRFARGAFHGLHQDVGGKRVDFRSFSGAIGRGSLQLVISRETCRAYADIDKHNPYQDVVSIIGHNFGEVIPHWLKRVFGKGKKKT